MDYEAPARDSEGFFVEAYSRSHLFEKKVFQVKYKFNRVIVTVQRLLRHPIFLVLRSLVVNPFLSGVLKVVSTKCIRAFKDQNGNPRIGLSERKIHTSANKSAFHLLGK